MLDSWGKGRSVSPGIRIRPERVLIVTEGTKTEPYYFRGFQRSINAEYGRDYVTVEVIGLGENTVSLFNHARVLCENDIDGYSHVWVVYDKDSFPSRDFNAVTDLCKSASRDGAVYHAAWTNEAFELWFLLHYCYLDAALSRKEYSSRLTGYLISDGLGAYKKNRDDMFDILKPRMSSALANARRLAKNNVDKTPANSNPGTTVHLLVEYLMPYLRP